MDNYQFKDFKYNSHYWVVKYLSERPSPLRILDVGTASGYLGALLKQKHHSLVGVESVESLAAQARCHYDQFHETDIETFTFPYREEFDCILFADVLEHLRDPQAVLERAVPCLKPGGAMIISVPNIANLVIRLSLLLGQFEYAERGILDRTHLRFYTLSSLLRMLRQCGLEAADVVATPIPVQLVFPTTQRRGFAILHELHYALVRSWKSLLGYQFVVRATVISR